MEALHKGNLCPSCLGTDCDRKIIERPILTGKNRAYPAVCCSAEARRLQAAEDLRQKGIKKDVIAGLDRVSGIPARFNEADFSGFRIDPKNMLAVKESLKFVQQFKQREKTGEGLVLLGPKGVGKTHLGCAILNALIQEGIACRYVYAESFLELARRRPLDQTDLGVQTLRAFATERLIFLDDVGIGNDTTFTEAQYTTLLDARYREKRPTVLASNLGLEDLEKVIGERTQSRLIETSMIIQINGQDRRLEP